MPFREGDYYVTDDRTGRKVLHSRTVREWTGAVVDRHHAIDLVRHPQEIQRLVIEKPPSETRPEPVPTFMGPRYTTVEGAHSAGSLQLDVASIVGWSAGDSIGIMLANGDHWQTTVIPHATLLSDTSEAYSEVAYSESREVTSISSALELASPLPWAVEDGAVVVNYTARIEADLAA